MAKWNYEGKVYELEDGLSAEQATAKIKSMLEDEQVSDAVQTNNVAGDFTDREVVEFVPSSSKSDRNLLGDITVGAASGATKAVEGTLQLGGIVADLQLQSNPLMNQAVRKAVDEGETVISNDPLPITTMVGDLFQDIRQSDAVKRVAGESGLEAEGLGGEIASIVTQFVLPAGKVAGAVEKGSRVGRLKLAQIARTGKSRLTKRQKLSLLGQQAAAAGVVDTIVSTDDTEGLHDFFELAPDRSPEKVVGETALEAASLKLLDKMTIGAEAGIASIILPPVLGAAFKTVSKVGAHRPLETVTNILRRNGVDVPLSSGGPKTFAERARTATVADIASLGAIPAARAGIEATTKAILKQEARILDQESVGAFDNLTGKLIANLRYRGFLDPEAANLNSLINAAVEGDVKRADRRLKRVEQKIDEFLQSPEMLQQTAVTKQTLMNAFMDVLQSGEKPVLKGSFQGIPDELFAAFKSARDVIDDLSTKLLDTGAVRALPEDAPFGQMSRSRLIEAIKENIEVGGYLRQRYAAYENPGYKIAQGSQREKEIFDLIKNSAGGREQNTVFNHIKDTLTDDAVLRVTDDQTLDTLTERQMREYIRLILSRTPAGSGGPSKFISMNAVQRVPLRKLNTQLLNRRKVESPVLKEILGQTKSPTEAYIATVSDLSTFIATDSFYTRLRSIADADMAEALFRRGRYSENFASPAERERLAELRQQNPAATLADIGPKQDSRYINVPERVAARRERVQIEIDAATQQGASEGRLRQLQQQLDNAETDVLNDLKTRGYFVLGRMNNNGDILAKDPGQAESAFGAMHNVAVPLPIWKSLSRRTLSEDEGLPNLMRQMYGGLLKLKGITQFSKTILSPITQVRNITSASMFALAQGNVGTGASLGQSFDLVMRDVVNKKILNADLTLSDGGMDYLIDVQKRGVIGSSAELREIQDNLRRSVRNSVNQAMSDHALVSDVATTAPKSARISVPFTGERIGVDIGSLDPQNRTNKFMQFMGKASDVYRAGDDVWKIYNYEFEASKLRDAYTNIIDNLRKNRGPMTDKQFEFAKDQATRRFKQFLGDENAASLEEAIKNKAADNVRNLVPNYELVPQLIKDIRGMPFGNFIAFPAEIMRTGFNTLETSMKELASDDAAIREIGMRRLMSSLSTFYVIGPALRDTAMTLTGTSPETMEAVNALSADFQKDSILVPLGKNGKGQLEIMDFSHFNPYDMLIRPFETVLNSLDEEGKLRPLPGDAGVLDISDRAARIAFKSFFEFIEPFTEESIALAALRDVIPKQGTDDSIPVISMIGRGGVTRTGAKVYREGETTGKKIERSLIHVLNQMGPSNLVPLRVPVGADMSELELSRLPRSLLQGDEFGISSIEPSTGREYAPAGELFRMLTGLQTQTVDPDRILRFKANEFKNARSGAATLFNDVVNREFADEDDYIQGYLAANQARLAAFRKFAAQIRHLQNLGLSDAEIRRMLKKERLGTEEVRSVLRGDYLPFSPNKKKLEEAQEKDHEIPTSLLRIMQRDLERLSIDPDFPEPAPSDAFDADTFTGPSSFFGDLLSSATQSVSPAPAVTPSVTSPASPASAITPPAPSPARVSNINPTILPNEDDRVIAERLRARG